MKTLHILVVIISLLLSGCKVVKQNQISKQSETRYAVISKLLKEKNFFKAKDTYYLSKPYLSQMHQDLVEASLDNAFNRLSVSNEKINELLQVYDSLLVDSVKLQLYNLKQGNSSKLFNYKDAKLVVDKILKDYVALLKPDEVDDYRNINIFWSALENLPPQVITIKDDVEILMKKDIAGLNNLEVVSRGDTTDFIFDTGANFSVTTESTAANLNMTIIADSIEVKAITGRTVLSRLAMCNKISIGQIDIENVVFLVFNDADLAFPQVNYQINGIIGFPVIEAMKEIQITTDGKFIVPMVQTIDDAQNMALDYLIPVISIDDEYYTFDSGANQTMLYKKYFEKNKAFIESNYEKVPVSMGGAGGKETFTGYNIDFELPVNGKTILLEKVTVLVDDINDKESGVYGNIGQDLIGKFNKMTINFNYMFIKFE